MSHLFSFLFPSLAWPAIFSLAAMVSDSPFILYPSHTCSAVLSFFFFHWCLILPPFSIFDLNVRQCCLLSFYSAISFSLLSLCFQMHICSLSFSTGVSFSILSLLPLFLLCYPHAFFYHFALHFQISFLFALLFQKNITTFLSPTLSLLYCRLDK